MVQICTSVTEIGKFEKEKNTSMRKSWMSLKEKLYFTFREIIFSYSKSCLQNKSCIFSSLC